MTHAEQILLAVGTLTSGNVESTFTRDEVRRELGLSRDAWMGGYTAIFQAMRADEPGGAPSIAQDYVGVIERVERGRFRLTTKGVHLVSSKAPSPTWRDSALAALNRCAARHDSRIITRQELISEELPRIEAEVATEGVTPAQTLSRVLQELRDEGLVAFTGDGRYLLLDRPVLAETEDFPDDALEQLAAVNMLAFGDVDTGDTQRLARQRRGQNAIRRRTLASYSTLCAFCGVGESSFLVASHISPWGQDEVNRGRLANVICMCRPHDALFEAGYFALSDTYEILFKPHLESDSIGILLASLEEFRRPQANPPDPALLSRHRKRFGFNP